MYAWAGFVSFVFLLLAVDLGLVHRRAHTVETREALISTGMWVGVAGAVGRFRYLRPGLAILLAFVGTKMLLSSVVQVPIGISLAAIVAVLGGAVLASWLRRGEPRQAPV